LRLHVQDYSLSSTSLNHLAGRGLDDRRRETSIMTTEPTDPALYFKAHIFCCTNTRPAGQPQGLLHREGQREAAAII